MAMIQQGSIIMISNRPFLNTPQAAHYLSPVDI